MSKTLLAIWLSTLAGLLILQSSFEGKTTVFSGLTDDGGQTISFEYPVEILEMLVVEGKQVNKGDVLLKVRRSDLILEQAVLNEKILEFNSRNQTSIASIESEIKSLNAKKIAQKADIDVQIKQLQAKYKTNKKLLSDITGEKEIRRSLSPLLDQIHVLKRQKAHVGKAIQAQIDHLNMRLNNVNRPIYAQINALKEQSSELSRQETELVVKADLSAKVGTVQYKPGERINSFQPILSIHALQPEFVKGYIHENVYNEVKAGQSVWVMSNTLSGSTLVEEGLVENIGNRIVEYPQRLKKNRLVAAWGREVLIRLKSRNNFMLGEKVRISLEPPTNSSMQEVVDTMLNWLNLGNIIAGEQAYAMDE